MYKFKCNHKSSIKIQTYYQLVSCHNLSVSNIFEANKKFAENAKNSTKRT